jgi:hypothetical protein
MVFDEISKVHSKTYILNCDEFYKMDRDNVIEANDSYYYSKQFFTCLKHCKENHPGSYFMSLTGDVSPVADWKSIIERSEDAIVKYGAGISAPNVDYTWHVAKNYPFTDNFWIVPNPDCTVWNLHPDVYNLLDKTDFAEVSKIGWGIDLIAVLFSKKLNKKILRDYKNTVQHPKDRGYTDDKAAIEYQQIQRSWVEKWQHLTL